MVFRRSIIKGFFEPQLARLGFTRSDSSHPDIPDAGLVQNGLDVFFDVETGADYPDGDEWFIVDMLFASNMKIPDNLKGPDYFTPMAADGGRNFWHHRELIRFKYGKSKKLAESLEFLRLKHAELSSLLEPFRQSLKRGD